MYHSVYHRQSGQPDAGRMLRWSVIVNYGIVLVVMAVLSLIFGVAAGNTCATASTGFARNLRKDMFYHIQDYSFENIDKFSVSSLVTRMTTDVANVQMSYHDDHPRRHPLPADADLLVCDGLCDGRHVWP